MTDPSHTEQAAQPGLRKLLVEADDLLHTANWCAGKLEVEMVHRRTISPRAEFEALVNVRQEIRDWRERRRAALSAAPPETPTVAAFNISRGPVVQATDGLGNVTYWHASPPETPVPQSEPVAWRDVKAERQRQVSVEGWTPEHDDEHTEAEMALAASCYAATAGGYAKGQMPPHWPWAREWWKPTYGRRDLIKAGALILAEIERLDRAAPPSSDGHAPKEQK